MAGAGRKVFTAGDVLTASQVQDYLQDQAVMVFAGTAARSSAIATPTEGMVAITTDTDELRYYNGSTWTTGLPFGAWQSWSPTLSGGWSNGTTGVWTAKYAQIGKTVIATGYFVVGDGSKGTTMNITLPVTAANAININGTAWCATTSSTGFAPLGVIPLTSTSIQLASVNAAGTNALWASVTSTAPITWAVGSVVSFTATYEAA